MEEREAEAGNKFECEVTTCQYIMEPPSLNDTSHQPNVN